MATFSETFEQSWSELEDSTLLSSSIGLLDLPSEVLLLVLRYLPLSDLANARLVSTRLQRLVDANSSAVLWANAALVGECEWVSNDNKRIVERAAGCGNVEALIKLAVAYLYDEGVPACDGKGSYDSLNGIKASEYLIQAEALCSQVSLFSWVLFRPPWSPEVISSKMCVFHHMRLACQNAESEQQCLPGIHYSIGKALSFYASLDDDNDNSPSAVRGAGDPLDWYERGATYGCPFSSLEVWRKKFKPRLRGEELESIRQLRTILSLSGGCHFEAEFELCRAYTTGYYGGVGEVQALGYIRQTMERAKPFLLERIFTLQDLNPDSRYILMDWLFEVACLKDYSPHVTHLIVNMVDSYLLRRHICKAKLQLLAISAALLASRWSVKESLTIREASWLTDRTYDYDDVVRMIGELAAVHKGNIKQPTIVDYLDILLCLIKADTVTRHMAYYLSESILLYPKFSRFTASFLASACLLEARVLLGHHYPWSSELIQATGLTVGDLKSCCLTMYQLCLTDKYRVTDSREVQLKAIVTRYGSEAFSGVSQMSLMSYKELKQQLGWDQDMSSILFTPPISSKRQKNSPKHKKCLSFLSDSQYLTSPPSSFISDGELNEDEDESHSRSCRRVSHSGSNLSSLSASLSDSQFSGTDRDQDFGFLVSPPGCGVPPLSPGSLSQCSSQSLTINPNGSGFPQPVFACTDDDEEIEEANYGLSSSLSSFPSSSRQSASSPLHQHTTVAEELHLMAEDSGVSTSSSTASVVCGSGESAPSTALDDDSRSMMDTLPTAYVGEPLHLMAAENSNLCSTSLAAVGSNNGTSLSSILDDDSRSLMDTLPPLQYPSSSTSPSDSRTDELTSFVSSLPLPTPSFAGVLGRDAENTPFELDPAADHTMAAGIKQNLHLGSCDTTKTYHHHHHMYMREHAGPRLPLQPVENFVRGQVSGVFVSKDARMLAPGPAAGRARSFIKKDYDRHSVENKAVDRQRSRGTSTNSD